MIAIQKAIYIHVCNSVTLKISIHLNHPCHKLVHCLQKCPYDPAVPLLGIYPEETKIEKNSCTPVFIAALFTTARRWKKPRCQLTDEWIRKLKLWYILLTPEGLDEEGSGSRVQEGGHICIPNVDSC